MPEDNPKAVKWYTKAAEQWHSWAQHYLALKYYTGEGVVQNRALAAEWLTKAGNSRLLCSQVHLGVMYATGAGVPQDDVQAYMWLSLAGKKFLREADDCVPGAGNVMINVRERMTEEQIAEANRLAKDKRRRWRGPVTMKPFSRRRAR